MDLSPPPKPRSSPIDWLRGFVILLMVLDHVRAFIGPTGANPTDLTTTTGAFVSVRWVTHLCAPVFVFLMGVSAALRSRSRPADTRRFLLSRGIWLIFLEVTWVSFCWGWDWTSTYLGVLWALGGSMVLLSMTGSVVPHRAAAVGIVLVVGLDWLQVRPNEGFWQLWFQPGAMTILGHRVGGGYALLPWFGVCLLGFGLSDVVVNATRRQMARVGLLMLAVFLCLRASPYTDPNPWSLQPSLSMTVADFLDPSKYPPSTAFLLMTLGVGALLLGGPAKSTSRLSEAIQVFGRVPMFVYLVHLPIAHATGEIYSRLQYGTPRVPADAAVSVPLILVAWGWVVLLLFPVCLVWDRLKRERRDLGWLRYL